VEFEHLAVGSVHVRVQQRRDSELTLEPALAHGIDICAHPECGADADECRSEGDEHGEHGYDHRLHR